MKKSFTLPMSAAAIALSLLAAFQNCSSNSLPTDLTEQRSTSVEPVDSVSLIVDQPSVLTGSTQTVRATGGVPPYIFSIDTSAGASVGSIDATTGVFLAGATAGTSFLKVIDSKNTPATASIGVSLAEAPVVPGTLDVPNAGSQTFTVPKFNTMTIEVYSGGGGGAGLTYILAQNGIGGPGGAGGSSSVTGGGLNIVAAGGQGGTAGHVRYSNGSGGGGGSASGGSENANGAPGNGAGPGGMAGGPGGGAGGGVNFVDPSYVPQPGAAPGGGGGGLGFNDIRSSTDRATSGGGGGGSYSKLVISSQASLPVGTSLTLNVGRGGTGGLFANDPARKQGADGGAGKIKITWN